MGIPVELILLSRYYGSKPDYVIAGGGNTSFKEGDRLWIKASGTALDGIDKSGFVCLSRSRLQKISRSGYSKDPFVREGEILNDLMLAVEGRQNKRPSVETSLHNLLSHPYIVHTHPTYVNALLCSVDAEKTGKRLFGDEVLFLDYVNPGYELFKYTEEKIVEYTDIYGVEPGLIFLRNHGMIIGGSDAGEIHSRSERVLKTLEAQFKHRLPPDDNASDIFLPVKIKDEMDDYFRHKSLFPVCRNNNLISLFVNSKANFENSVRPLTPDNVVYCKSDYLFSGRPLSRIKNDFESFNLKYAYYPRIIAIEKEGLISLGPDEKSAETTMEVFQDMLKISFLAGNFGGPQFLTEEQIRFIDTWEVENYRRSIKS